MTDEPSRSIPAAELEDLRARLAEAEEVLRAIRSGEVDAVLVTGEGGQQVYTLTEQKLYGQIVAAKDELQSAKAFLDGVINAIADPVFVKDDKRRFVLVNAALCAMVGRPRESLLGEDGDNMFPKEQVAVFRRIDADVLETGKENLNEESLSDLSSGEVRTIVTRKSRYIDPAGKRFLAGVIRDITERKRAEAAVATANSELERRVAERTAELLVSNQELESFASSVSHDLRAPLRGIDGWSQAVLEDCGAQLDERGRKYLKMVRSETHRMDQLVDNLLELSRVTRATMRRESVDLTAMAQELEASLRSSQPERAVDFVIAPGIVAHGDAVLLRAALQNLLQNAWKFTGGRPRERIEVGCASEQGRTVYHVRDDGAGFDMRYAGKLFVPFERLHSLAEFSGTGIGLATVQRIIHRHGGKVWATAEVDQGATFHFTLTA